MEIKPHSYHGIVTQYSFRVKRDDKTELLGFSSISSVKKINKEVVNGDTYTELGMAMVTSKDTEGLFTITMPEKDADKLISDFNKWKKGKAK